MKWVYMKNKNTDWDIFLFRVEYLRNLFLGTSTSVSKDTNLKVSVRVKIFGIFVRW